ncbi:MAG TPA: PRC-barrel domain-containing protein [Burkholderiales bacterium]|nr:PRC-barrel domain-containing protein [Burkholderiales bacterium]
MLLRTILVFLMVPLAALASASQAAAVSELLGQPVTGLRGQNIGPVEELIVDVSEGRVLYIIVRGAQQYYTVPVRALHRLPGNGGLRLDMALEGDAARIAPDADPRFRRAGRLLGQPIQQPGDGAIGSVQDILFEPGSGRIGAVRVQTPQGPRDLPAGVLARGHFPPITLWPEERAGAGR